MEWIPVPIVAFLLISIVYELMKYSRLAEDLREKQVPMVRRIQGFTQSLNKSRQETEKTRREDVRDMEHDLWRDLP